MKEQTREKLVKATLRTLAVVAVLYTLLSIGTIIIGLCNIPIPVTETIILCLMTAVFDYMIIKLKKEGTF